MSVIKRSRQASSGDLVKAIEELVVLLKDQKEDEAIEALNICVGVLRESEAGSDEHKSAIAGVIDAFEGEHELMAYTIQREGSEGKWTLVEQLADASSRVISLANRMK